MDRSVDTIHPARSSRGAKGVGPLASPRTSPRQAGPDSRHKLPGIAHDTRNVLATLTLYCDLLEEPGVLTPRYRHYAAELRAIATASAGLVDQMVSLQQEQITQQGDTNPSPRPAECGWIVDLAKAVKGLESLLAGIAGPRISLEIECMPSPGTVRLSPEDLSRVLANLVRNAQEAMPAGGRIRITVQQSGGRSFLKTRAHAQPEGLLVCVQDSGPGISAAVLHRIFEPGFSTRVQEVRRDRWSGRGDRGLGLSIVRALIEAAGGSVQVTSAPGCGTRFEILLPLLQTFVTGSPKEPNVKC